MMNPPLTSTPNDSSRRRSGRTPKSTHKKREIEKQKHATPHSAKRTCSSSNKIKQRRQSASDDGEDSITDAACLPMTDVVAVNALRACVEQMRKQRRKSKSSIYQEANKRIAITKESPSKLQSTVSLIDGESESVSELCTTTSDMLLTANIADKTLLDQNVGDERPKAKRGRPRKSAASNSEMDTSVIEQGISHNHSDSIDDADLPGSEKKKCGRPRKHIVHVSSSEEFSEFEQTVAVNTMHVTDTEANDGVKKKAGRPRKSMTAVYVADDACLLHESETNHTFESIENTKEGSVKKKPGRPRKSLTGIPRLAVLDDKSPTREQNHTMNNKDFIEEHHSVTEKTDSASKSITDIPLDIPAKESLDREQKELLNCVHNVEEHDNVKKKVGRPRKSMMANSSDNKSAECEDKEALNGTQNTEEIGSIKKKVGRPRKSLVNSISGVLDTCKSLDHEQIQTLHISDNVANHDSVKQKVGRPRKSISSPHISDNNSHNNEQADITLKTGNCLEKHDSGKKKPGRPRKSITGTPNTDDKSADTEHNEMLNSSESAESHDSGKKKPGRPRKSITGTPKIDDKSADTEQNEMLNSSESAESHDSGKKKPGRPRKSITGTQKIDDKSADTEQNEILNSSGSAQSHNGIKKKLGRQSNKGINDDIRNTSRSGRKRKRVDYSALDDSGFDFEERKDTVGVKQKKLNQTDDEVVEDDVDDHAGDDEDDPEDETITAPKAGGSRSKARKNIVVESSPGTSQKVDLNCRRCDYKCNSNYLNIVTHMACQHQALWTTENPEGLDDDKSLAAIIKIKKYLNCTRCDKRINFLQYYRKHIEWCGREDVCYTCSRCGHEGLKMIWKDCHETYCGRKFAQQEQVAEAENRRAELEQTPTDGKRRAATKAKWMLHDLSKDLDAGEHSDDSLGDPSVSLDKESSETDDDIDPHDDLMEDDLGDNNSGESDGGDVIDFRVKPSPRGTGSSRKQSSQITVSYYNSYPDMMRIAEQKFSQEEIFPELLPRKQNWNVITENELATYSPKPGPSIGFKFKSEKAEMCNLDLYETKLIDNFPMFYTGLSVWHMAWCPVPADCSTDQYLAVTGKLDHDAVLEVHKRQSGPGVIQIWNMGVTSNHMSVTNHPRLAYSIAHDYGHVTGMQWCPSGCWQPSNLQTDRHHSRLGLLALTFTDGTVRIISIPRLDETADEAPVYRAEPSMSLMPHRYWETCNMSCSCLAWKPVDGHTVIMAGYSDGRVRLFNLVTESPFLVLDKSPHRTLVPYHSFLAHPALVRTCGWTATFPNKVVTGGNDMETRWWDLDDTRCPRNADNSRSSLAIRFACPLVHMGTCISTDDGASYNGNRSVYQEGEAMKYVTVGEYKWNRKPLYPITLFLQNGCAWGADFNNWLDFCFMCDSRGHVMAMPMMDTVLGSYDSYRASNRLKLFETTLREKRECDKQTVDKSKTETEEECHCNSDKSESCKYCANQLHSSKGRTSETVVKSDPVLQNNRMSETTSSQSEDVLQNSCERTKVNFSVEGSNTGTSTTDKTESDIGNTTNTAQLKGTPNKQTCDINTYSEMVDKTCLVFKEYVKTKNAGSHNREPRDNYSRFPITSWNAVSSNPNMETCYWLAFGGESGLIRLVNIMKLRPQFLVDYMYQLKRQRKNLL